MKTKSVTFAEHTGEHGERYFPEEKAGRQYRPAGAGR